MTKQAYDAVKLWHMPEQELYQMLPDDEDIELTFSNGETHTVGSRETILSYYFGRYHREYPQTPVLPTHHVLGRQIKKGIELEILKDVFWDCYNHNTVEIETLCKLVYDTINYLYNVLTVRQRSYVSTISILDFVDVVEHPEIKKANAETKPLRLSIDQTYSKVWEVLTREGELRGNTIARMAKSGLVSKGQILQCISQRDFVTDIDSNIFRRPILSNYTRGMRTLYDSMVESRSASKAQVYQKDYVAKSEYFSREMQLLCSVITRIHPGDCGSNEYHLFKVNSGDLPRIIGKYYRQNDGTLGEIHETDRHLVGRIIQMRSVIKCQHPDSYGVCETCYGAGSYSIMKGTNIGHVAASVTGEKISQNLLSTKHLDGSAKDIDFEISDYDRRFIRAEKDMQVVGDEDDELEEIEASSVIKLTEQMAGLKVRLSLDENQAGGLPDIENADIDKLSPSKISSLTEVNLIYRTKEGFDEITTVPVSMGVRRSWLTRDALEYIKKYKWRLTDKGMYEIDMREWDVNLPLFQLPFKNADMVQYLKTVSSFIKSPPSDKKKTPSMENSETPDRALMEFYDLINRKLTINIVHLEVIVLAQMIRSATDPMDYRPPRPIGDGQLSNFKANMDMRSLGVSMAHQSQADRLFNIRSFTITDRPDSPYDNLLVPFPVVNPRD